MVTFDSNACQLPVGSLVGDSFISKFKWMEIAGGQDDKMC
jgi:hypothetical protein